MPTTTNTVSDKQLLQCSGPIFVLKVKDDYDNYSI